MNASRNLYFTLFQKLYKASEYNLPYIVEHLTRAGHFDKLRNLIIPEFMWAKRIKYGSHKLFVDDLELCIRASEDQGVEGIPYLLSYNLLYLFLKASAENYKPEVLRLISELVQLLPVKDQSVYFLGLKARAEDYAELLTNPLDRAQAFRAIAGGGVTADIQKMFEREKRRLDSHFLRRAFEEAQLVEDVEEKAKLMYELSLELARAGEVEAAFIALDQISSPEADELGFKQIVLKRLPSEIARSGRHKEALEAASLIMEEYDRIDSLFELGRGLVNAGLVKEAIEASLYSENKLIEGIALECNADYDKLLEYIEEIRGISDSSNRERFINELAKILSKLKLGRSGQAEYEAILSLRKDALNNIWLGKHDKALEILKKIEGGLWTFGLEDHIDEFIEGLVLEGRYEDAKLLSEKGFTGSTLRGRINEWSAIRANFNDAFTLGGPQRVLSQIKTIDSPLQLIEALVIAAPELVRVGKFDEVIELFDENQYENGVERKAGDLAIYLARAGRIKEAEDLAAKVLQYSDRHLKRAVFAIAGVLSGMGRHKEIVPIARKLIDNIRNRCEILIEIATKLVEVDEKQAVEVLEEALIDAEYDEKSFHHLSEVLVILAVSLMRAGELEKAFIIATDVMHKIPEVWAEIVSEYVESLFNVDRGKAEKVFEEALEKAVRLSDDILFNKHTILRCLVISTARRKLFAFSYAALENIDENHVQKPIALAQLAGLLEEEDAAQARELLRRAELAVFKLSEQLDYPNSEDEFDLRENLIFVEKTMKWVKLSPREQILVERKYNRNDATIAMISKAIRTGGFEGVLRLLENPLLNQKNIRAQILSGIAVALAEQGRFEEAQNIAKGLQQPNLAVRMLEFHYMTTHGDLLNAERIADKFIELDLGTSAAMYEILALKYAKSGDIHETINSLIKIPASWNEYKYRAQMMCLIRFLLAGNLNAAHKIVEMFEDRLWKSLAISLLDISQSDHMGNDISKKIDEMLDMAGELRKNTEDEDIQYWILVSFTPKLEELGNPEKILDYMDGIYEYEFRDELRANIAADLASVGSINDALQLLDEIKDQRDVIDAISLITSHLEDCKPEIKLSGIHKLVTFAKNRGLDFTVQTVSKVVPLFLENDIPDKGANLIWQTYQQIAQLPKWWSSSAPQMFSN